MLYAPHLPNICGTTLSVAEWTSFFSLTDRTCAIPTRNLRLWGSDAPTIDAFILSADSLI